jgi:hypothetical protein
MDGHPTSNDHPPRGLVEVSHHISRVSARHDSPVGGREELPPPPFEDDSDEMWDEVMHNLGVDPATGGSLEPSDPVPPKSADQLARELKDFNEWRKQFQPPEYGDRRSPTSSEPPADHSFGSAAVAGDLEHPRNNLGVDSAATDPSHR